MALKAFISGLSLSAARTSSTDPIIATVAAMFAGHRLCHRRICGWVL